MVDILDYLEGKRFRIGFVIFESVSERIDEIRPDWSYISDETQLHLLTFLARNQRIIFDFLSLSLPLPPSFQHNAVRCFTDRISPRGK